MKPTPYYAGYDDTASKIREIGFSAVRDEFNLIHPPGQPFEGSVDGYWYAHGSFAALADNLR